MRKHACQGVIIFYILLMLHRSQAFPYITSPQLYPTVLTQGSMDIYKASEKTGLRKVEFRWSIQDQRAVID